MDEGEATRRCLGSEMNGCTSFLCMSCYLINHRCGQGLYCECQCATCVAPTTYENITGGSKGSKGNKGRKGRKTVVPLSVEAEKDTDTEDEAEVYQSTYLNTYIQIYYIYKYTYIYIYKYTNTYILCAVCCVLVSCVL
jgi:hypothetical protein